MADDDNVPIIDETPEDTINDTIDEELSELPEDDDNNGISHSDTRPELGLLQQAMLTFQKHSQQKLNEKGDDDSNGGDPEQVLLLYWCALFLCGGFLRLGLF